ncbi:hypothetical protein FNH22_30615 [Fulvivirga sp. M361]|uniref:hypothetical protein n=1 Tax=Fulvivirga sp. M361 TaxID=2594266 RepID=UPI00117A79BB|nr:hypothetical protein [Fulvivirga sp. M361]TRX47051.1 hypothetical protein FNH22_30615 [Fulvivirga sp. M361]
MATIKALEDEVSDLNRLIIDLTDQNKAIGAERDKYKNLLSLLINFIKTGESTDELMKLLDESRSH